MTALTDLAMEGFTPAPTLRNGAPGFLGIDSGLSGYSALLSADGRDPKAFATPRLPDGDYDLVAIRYLAMSWRGHVALAVLEKQQDYPGQSQANFMVGGGYYMWRTALTFAEIPFDEILPRTWKTAMGIMPPIRPAVVKARDAVELKRAAASLRRKFKKGGEPTPEERDILDKARDIDRRRTERTKEAKGLAIASAQRLFPSFDFRQSPSCRVPHDGKAEAVLLAVTAMRRYLGRT